MLCDPVNLLAALGAGILHLLCVHHGLLSEEVEGLSQAWHMHIIPALGNLGKEYCHELEAGLGYRVSIRRTKATQ